MRHLTLFIFISLSTSNLFSQTIKDLFNPSSVQISWLGVDYSHVKLIGEFTQFSEAGTKSSVQIRDNYFIGWNQLILNEAEKYDIKGMLRKGEIFYDTEMMNDLNASCPTENMEVYNEPKYTDADIVNFVSDYNLEGKTGIGIVWIAESLNKSMSTATYHFLAINMSTKEILLAKKLVGKPGGFGLRNYWAGSIYSVIKSIKKSHYKTWKAKHG